MDPLESGSIPELAAYVASPAWSERLAGLIAVAGGGALEAVDRLRVSVEAARARLDPEHGTPELVDLVARVRAGSSDGLQLDALRASLPIREHERLFARIASDLGRAAPWADGGVGRSNRARRARNLFVDYSGRSHLAGAAPDQHGNPLGGVYDLAPDGAFAGSTVHVLQLYAFDFGPPTAALERKGFTVDRRTAPGAVGDFTTWLRDARQLWLISPATATLKPGHLSAIEALWRRGGALYLWGDNDPFWADANAILAAVVGDRLSLAGNDPGGQVMQPMAEQNGFGPRLRLGNGFLPHPVTTGLAHLFEGITVSSVKEAAATAHGFVPLLWGSAANLITIARPPTADGGALMVDGAFTRLYCNWDDAGSARYVANAACWLAGSTPVVSEGAEFSAAGALVGTCDWTHEPSRSWLVLTVRTLDDELRHTTDQALSDPLSVRADPFSDRVYSEAMGRWILAQPPERRVDPESGASIGACLPLVDLGDARNHQSFTEVLCAALLGGKELPAAAELVFFAAVERKVDRDGVLHPEAWRFLYHQALTWFRATPELGDLGPTVPLLEAFAGLLSPATPDRVKLRRSLRSLGVIGRTLVREGRSTPAAVRAVGRKALLVHLLRDAIAADRVHPGSVRVEVEELLYDRFHGVPRYRGGRVAQRRPTFARIRTDEEAELVEAVGGPLLGPAGWTVALHALLPHDLRRYRVWDLVDRLRADDPAFRALYDGDPEPDPIPLLNARFAAWPDPGLTDPHATAPPFETTLGPSVLRCSCGVTFADPAARSAHLRQAYRATGSGWSPSQGSLHCDLHRAVQVVVRERFPDATEVDPEMVPAVVAWLARRQRGFVADPLLPENLDRVLASYLALRRAGQPHPDPQQVLTLEVRGLRHPEP